jgi:peptidoglycan/LPS O-acetylase OafA/YrhL
VFVATLFGNASFGIYVWHGAIRGTVQKLASIVGLDAGSIGYWSFNFVVLSVVSIAVALATFHWIEMPIMGWFRKKVNVRLAK